MTQGFKQGLPALFTSKSIVSYFVHHVTSATEITQAAARLTREAIQPAAGAEQNIPSTENDLQILKEVGNCDPPVGNGL